MTVLVIGSSGYLGEYVTEELLSRGHDVVGFDVDADESAAQDVETDGSYTPVRGDMTTFADLSGALAAHDVSKVVQLAYYGTPENGLLDSAEEHPYNASNANVTGFGNVLESARQRGVESVTWASSTVVYGPPSYYERLGVDTVDEESPTAPESLYGACKVHNEYVASMYRDQYGMDVAGIRLPLIFGPERYPGAQPFVVDLFEEVAAGGSITLPDGDTTWDLMYEKDVGRLFADVAETGQFSANAYNVVGHTVTVGELAELVVEYGPAGADVVVQDGSADVLPAPLDDSRFRDEFDFRPAYDAERAVVDYLETLG